MKQLGMKQLQHNNFHFQKGVSKFGMLMLFIMIGGFLTVGLKVAPLYVDHNLITGICEELVESGQAADMSIREVRERVSNSLRINSISDFELDDIKMRKANGMAIITVAYERRLELVANLDIVAKFNTVLQ